MRKLLISLLVIFSFLANAQLTILIDSVPEYTPNDADIYLAGDLNSWNPADPNFKLAKITEITWQIILPEMDHGRVIQFKFTRGSWGTVEKGANGEEISDRHYTFGNGGTINPIILNWADNGGGGGSTASDNVSIMDDAFYMPQFDRNRRIWIYLPPDYETSENRYPVLYMHDGQNLFDIQTSFAGEWEVDETLDALYSTSLPVPIVVGIDNGGINRTDEYTPWVNQEYGVGGEGSLYIDFIIETLKPFIDGNYRTMADRNNTAIMGSSLGGLISHYGSLKFQNTFSKAGIFSPSYWWSDTVWTFTNENPKQSEMMIYQMCGDQESASTVPNMNLMNTYLIDAGFLPNELFLKVVVGGQHNEQLWRNEFEEAYLWLFSDYISSITEHRLINKLEIVPNPSSNKISFPDYVISNNDSIEIIDMNGIAVLSKSPLKRNSVNISKLNVGTYVIRITNDNEAFEGKFIRK